MKPKKHFETPDLFRARLDQILDPSHQIFILAGKIDWSVSLKRLARLIMTRPAGRAVQRD